MLQETLKYEYLERMIAKRGIRKTIIAVSYTHLDVYKRQRGYWA